MHEFLGKRVTVMGLGLHGGGLATAAWFLGHGAHVTVTDLKTRAQLQPSVMALERVAKQRGVGSLRLVLGKHDAKDFRDADLIVQNPGVPRESKFLAIARAARVPIENEASLFLKIVHSHASPDGKRGKKAFLPLPGGGARGGGVHITAITGTRGKSTTSALIAAILRADGRRAFLAGNIRIPMLGNLDAVLRAARRGPVDVVIELSSWHCELLSRATGGPDIAVLTNLYPDHLNRYRSLRAYAVAKTRLVRFQHDQGVVVANREQPIVRAMAKCSSGRVLWFSRRRMDRTTKRLRALLALPGEHNTMNCLAAIATARALRVNGSAIRRGLRSFRGLPGRLETVARRGGVTYVNDTCATSPDGTIAALQALTESGSMKHESGRRGAIILIAGGVDKELEYAVWAKEVTGRAKALILLPGTATEKMKRSLSKSIIHDSLFMIHDALSMRSAVQTARRLAHAGDTVLLSPGAASFGLFQHEFDRGDQFNQEVKRYK
ncbi:UDP-N-acetylmuramoyl-L-alanine--D-glutamate ligase [Candidatus Uhrbacteria bacterium]|nr:UDP-N-acetylmuramoyl-L-alanine--D-glutamate ligase [Candidatus Uhrbacteria bacterium]